MGTDVAVDVQDTTMDIYIAQPDGEPRGAVLLLQEAFGVNDHIRDLCHRLAAEGYVVAAPHLFHRSGDPELGYDDMQEVIPFIMQLTAEDLEADVQATLDHLKTMGFGVEKVAAVGFCMGGTISFVAGCHWKLGAAVTFYGGGIAQGRFGNPPLFDLAPTLQTPWLGLFGDLDDSIPTQEVEGLRSALENTDVESEIVRYPDANHGFNCDARSSYHEASAKDAWTRMLGWLERHVG